MDITPVDNELLSSCLCRMANQYGMSPYRFCKQYFPELNVWKRDIDRCDENELTRRSEFLCAVRTNIREHLLVGYGTALYGVNSYRRLHQAITPWMNSLGIYDHLKSRFGLAFCPKCLDEHPGFSRLWRLSFCHCCVKHGVQLFDRCPVCSGPIDLQKHRLSIDICACGCRLSKIRKLVVTKDNCLGLQLQIDLEKALLSGMYEAAGLSVPLSELLNFLKSVTTALQGRTRAHRSNSLIRLMKGTQIELSTLKARERKVLAYGLLLSNWPDGFLQYSRELNFTQAMFNGLDNYPEWVSEVLSRLPPGLLRDCHRGPRYRKRVFLNIAENRYCKSEGWRERHADLMMKAMDRNGL